jgi:ABC-2 type transport system permease protein
MWLKIRRVARHELFTVLKRRSAQVVIFGLPLFSLLCLVLLNLLARPQLPADMDIERLGEGLRLDDFNPGDMLSDFVFESSGPVQQVGVVDLTGQIGFYQEPGSSERITLVPYESQIEAYQAFRHQEIQGYFLIPATYPNLVANETITFYAERVGLANLYQGALYELLLHNFVAEAGKRERLLAPISSLELVDLTNVQNRSVSAANYLGSVALVFFVSILFYLTVMGAAGYLLQSLAQEKQNRVLEILLSSLRPFELLLGKLLGLAVVGVIQIVIWSLLSFLLFGSYNLFHYIPLPDLSLLTWILIVAHFLIGYLVYSSIYAGLGAIVPSPKESSQYALLVALPVFVPLLLLGAITGAPNSKVAVALSFFPLTSPLAMPMRLVVTAVAPLQWLLSLGLALATAVVALWIATRLFRSRTLLSGY